MGTENPKRNVGCFVQEALHTYLPHSSLMNLLQLRVLGLENLHLIEDHLPLHWMTCLAQLQQLKLGGNLFRTVPASLRALPGLEVLSMVDNEYLQLSMQDVETICGMRKLKVFELSRTAWGGGGHPQPSLPEGCPCWSDDSMDAIDKMKELWPHLQIKM